MPSIAASDVTTTGSSSISSTRRPWFCRVSCGRSRRIRPTPDSGRPKVCPAARTSRHCVVATVTGSVSVNVVPTPTRLSTSTVPWRRSTLSRTTSRPTPRPERSVTTSLVDRPGWKIRAMASRGLIAAASAELMAPRVTAAAFTAAGSTPAPSSWSSTTSVPPRCDAATEMLPSRGLPSRSRTSGASSPWSSALRIRWVRGPRICSRTARSTSVSPPRSRGWPLCPRRAPARVRVAAASRTRRRRGACGR